MTYNAIPVRSAAGEALSAVAVGAALPSGTTTSVACYLQKGSDVTWHWGLNNDNSWFVLNGRWITTPYTGLTKFVTDTSRGDLLAAAANAIRYYNMSGYTLESLFAADGIGGYNYPIIANGVELYPKF